MEKHVDIVLKKLARRRKMFEDYMALVIRPDMTRGIMRCGMGDVKRERSRETRDMRREKFARNEM